MEAKQIKKLLKSFQRSKKMLNSETHCGFFGANVATKPPQATQFEHNLARFLLKPTTILEITLNQPLACIVLLLWAVQILQIRENYQLTAI